jgi:hypothetical protein
MAQESQESKKITYDRAKNHFMGNFPEALPIEQAYVHIGFFLGWIIDHNLYSEYFEDESETQIIRFRMRQMSCTILSEVWDGYLGHELFSYEGNMFTYYYYGGGIYKKDYETTLAKGLPSIYHVQDTWENFAVMTKKIGERFEEWKKIIG